jgi:hypothetical protein
VRGVGITQNHRGGCGIRARAEKEPQTIKKQIFHWRDTKGGRNSLGERSTRSKIKQNEGMSEVE